MKNFKKGKLLGNEQKEVQKRMNKGAWAFVIGLVIAIVINVLAGAGTLSSDLAAVILVVLGLIVGFINLLASAEFLLALIGLVVVSMLTYTNPATLDFIGEVSSVAFYIGAVILVIAVKTIFSEGQSK